MRRPAPAHKDMASARTLFPTRVGNNVLYVAVALETANSKGNCLLAALHHLGKAYYVLGEMRDAEERLCQALHEHQQSDHNPVITLVIIDRALYGLDIAYDLCRIYYEQGEMVPQEVAWFLRKSHGSEKHR